MKIQDQQPRSTVEQLGVGGTRASEVSAATSAAADEKKAAKGSAGPAATVSLSSRSRELHGALAAAKAAPDVRADKVADVKAKLERGTYVIDPTRIARGILDSRA